MNHPVEIYAASLGDIFQAFRYQDSGCLSFGVQTPREKLFIKGSVQPHANAHLQRVASFYAAFKHPTIPTFHTGKHLSHGGFAITLSWIEAECLYDYVKHPGHEGRMRPQGPYTRFYKLPTHTRLNAIQSIYNLHTMLARKGIIAVDLYDGNILYDFTSKRVWMCDFDEYRTAPFILDKERLPGSRRFMAPEEFTRGARIDQTTNVYTLGCIAFELLTYGLRDPETWPASPQSYAVVHKACSPQRSARYPTVDTFTRAWDRALTIP